MRRRWSLLIVCVACLLTPRHAAAHRLDAEVSVGPFGAVRVESWYETGEVPKGASVKVYAIDETLFIEGHLDEKGAFAFTYPGMDRLRVVVNAGPGHRTTVRVNEEQVRRGAALTQPLATCVACLALTPYVAAPLLVEIRADAPPALPSVAERRTGPQYMNLIFGIAIVALAACAATILLRARRGKGNRSG